MILCYFVLDCVILYTHIFKGFGFNRRRNFFQTGNRSMFADISIIILSFYSIYIKLSLKKNILLHSCKWKRKISKVYKTTHMHTNLNISLHLMTKSIHKSYIWLQSKLKTWIHPKQVNLALVIVSNKSRCVSPISMHIYFLWYKKRCL